MPHERVTDVLYEGGLWKKSYIEYENTHMHKHQATHALLQTFINELMLAVVFKATCLSLF